MNLSYFFALTVLGLSVVSLQAQSTNAPINTIPEGITTYTLPKANAHQFVSSYLSAPLANDPMYTGAVASVVGTNQITIGDNPPPWPSGTFTESINSTPYYLKFLSGAESGRILQVAANTTANGTTSVTLDIKDNTTQSVSLATAGFAVEAGDTFEIFQGDTLGSMFGTNTSGSPLILNPGTAATADTVSVFSPTLNRFLTYYFDNTTSPGSWKEVGATGSFNNSPIRPYQAFLVTRNGGTSGLPALTFTLTGRVAEVDRMIKVTSGIVAFDSTGFAIDTPFSKLNLGTNWVTAPVPVPPALPAVGNADTVALWNGPQNRFDTYFELADSTWRKYGGGTNDYTTNTIPAGVSVVFSKVTVKPGASSFLQTPLPYNLNTTGN